MTERGERIEKELIEKGYPVTGVGEVKPDRPIESHWQMIKSVHGQFRISSGSAFTPTQLGDIKTIIDHLDLRGRRLRETQDIADDLKQPLQVILSNPEMAVDLFSRFFSYLGKQDPLIAEEIREITKKVTGSEVDVEEVDE